MNDECADKIADNRYSIAHSRDWLVDDGGVVDRIHRMSAKTVSITSKISDNLRVHIFEITFISNSII